MGGWEEFELRTGILSPSRCDAGLICSVSNYQFVKTPVLKGPYLAGPWRDLQEAPQGCPARDQDPEFTTGGGAGRREKRLNELTGRAGNYLSHKDQAAGWTECPDKSYAASLQNQARN